ncbi:MAG: DUF2058 family protein [Myxococcaceae bacterium]
MQGLKDKLLKAGLVSKEQADRAEAQPRTPAPRRDPPRHERNDRGDRGEKRHEARPEPSIPKLPPMAGSKQAHREMAKKQLELDRALRELVLAAQVPVEPGAMTFHFVTRKGKLRRLDLSEAQARLLSDGKLAIVERQDPDKIDHALVPPATAEQMKSLFEKSVRFWNKGGEAVGFLTEEEIVNRQAEISEPEAPEAQAAAEPEAPEEEKKSDGAWVTIKRAPLAE